MSKSDVIEIEGTVVEKLPNTMFQVEYGKRNLIQLKLFPYLDRKQLSRGSNSGLLILNLGSFPHALCFFSKAFLGLPLQKEL